MIKLNVKQLTALLIAVLAAYGGYVAGYAAVLPQFAAAAIAALAVESSVSRFILKRWRLSDSALITGLIVGVVTAPGTSWLAAALLAAGAIASKFILRLDKRPLFNPAALALLAGTVFFGVHLSWWVDANHSLTIAAGALLLAVYTGHWRQVLTFVVLFSALVAFWAGPAGAAATLNRLYFYVSISTFFVFFMMTDPRTSPIMPADLPAYAAITAVGSMISAIFYPVSLFLGGLLLANLCAPWLNRRRLKIMAAKRAAAVRAAAAAAPAAAPPAPAA